MHDYYRFIIDNNASLSAVEKDSFRNVSKYTYRFSRNTIREVMLKLVEEVENKVALELKQGKEPLCMTGGQMKVQLTLLC